MAKADKAYYSAGGDPGIAVYEELPYVSIHGQGSPDGASFAQATEALYTAAYGVRALMKEAGVVFTVPKLEGLWWVEGGLDALQVPREQWLWKLLLRMPDGVSLEMVENARRTGMAKKRELAGEFDRVAFEHIREGECVQMLHVGPYRTEPETLGHMHRYMAKQALVQCGLHHEIYLSDPRKTASEALKTILRLPVSRVGK